MQKLKPAIKILLVGLVGVLITIFLTFPFVTHLSENFFNNNDYYLNSWVLWYTSHSIFNGSFFHPQLFFDSPQLYPFPDTLAQHDFFALPCLLIYSPALFITNNPVLATNIFIFASFILNFVSSYYFLNKLVDSYKASIIGAMIFSFSSGVIWLGGGWFDYLYRFLIPPFIYLLFSFLNKPSIKTSLFLGAVYTLIWFNTIEIAIFLITTSLIIFIFYTVITLIKDKSYYKKLLRIPLYLAACVIFVPIILYFFKPYIDYSQKEHFFRNINDTEGLSAKPIDYFLPSGNNLLYKKVTNLFEDYKINIQKITDYNKGDRNLLLPGYVAIALLALYIFSVGKRKSDTTSKIALVSLLTFLVLVLFSFGPYVQIGNRLIKLPYYYLFNISSLIKASRTPPRFMFIGLFLLSIVATKEFANITKNNHKKESILFILFMALMCLEYKVIYPFEKGSFTPLKFDLQGKIVLFAPIRDTYTLDGSKYLVQHFTNNFVSVNGGTGSQAEIKHYYKWKADLINDLFTDSWFKILKIINISYVVIDKTAANSSYFMNQDILNQLSKFSKYIVYEDPEWAVLDVTKYFENLNYNICTTTNPADLGYDFGITYTPHNNTLDLNYVVTNNSDCIYTPLGDLRYIKLSYNIINVNGYRDTFYIRLPPYIFEHQFYENSRKIIINSQQIPNDVAINIGANENRIVHVIISK